jgi:hypothetical protein
MTKRYDFSELDEIIQLAMREQSTHPQGLNSSQTHGTLYPVGDPRNDDPPQQEQATLASSKLMRIRAGSRRGT